MKEIVTLNQGSGGEKTARLIQEYFLPYLENPVLNRAEDGANLRLPQEAVFTTDSFTVNPFVFPGGDIGKLSIAGVCNDLAVMGAKPLYVSMNFILEEGFLLSQLKTVIESVQKELKINGATVAAADTKVVPSGGADKIYIGASAIGQSTGNYGAKEIPQGATILVSGPVGDHGAVILMKQNSMQSKLESDCRSLWPAIERLIFNTRVYAMRDITRGGLATILNEMSESCGLEFYVREKDIPIREETSGFCEILGFHPYHLACEGQFVCFIHKEDAQKALEILKQQGFENASITGTVHRKGRGVVLQTLYGSHRHMEPVRGELLPRIC